MAMAWRRGPCEHAGQVVQCTQLFQGVSVSNLSSVSLARGGPRALMVDCILESCRLDERPRGAAT